MALGFTPQETSDLKTVFDLFDVSDKDSIETEDLRKALRLLGFKLSRTRVQQISSDVQTPGAKDRGLTDFNSFLQIVSQLQGASYDRHGEILQAFSYLDIDGDGYLSVSDLREASDRVRLRLSQSDLDGMVTVADKTGNGKLSEQEFIDVMMKTNLFR